MTESAMYHYKSVCLKLLNAMHLKSYSICILVPYIA